VRRGSLRQDSPTICNSAGRMREPVFIETVQIGIVVRDLETAMRRYVDEYGIGPWDIHEFNAGKTEDLHEHGQPVERSWRLAATMVGQVQWELIEPRRRERLRALPCREG
jgi:methylmalonyl-CoA/ethylmalonyl-CoA epimerase